MEYRGLGPRFVAALIDAILLSIPLCVLGFLLGGNDSGFSVEGAAAFLYFLVSFGGWVAYYTLFEGSMGATPGKLALGMRVVRLDGQPIDMRQALIRTLLRIVDSLPFLYLLGAILVLTSPTKQRLGDRVAGTVVVGKTSPVGAPGAGV